MLIALIMVAASLISKKSPEFYGKILEIDKRRCWTEVAAMRPGQMSIGFWERDEKVDQILDILESIPSDSKKNIKLEKKALEKYLRSHPQLVTLGPRLDKKNQRQRDEDGNFQRQVYVKDANHHLGAYFLLGIKNSVAEIEEDLSDLEPKEFIQEVEKRQLVRLVNETGKPQKFENLPLNAGDYSNDSARSIAGADVKIGAIEKTSVPMFEFAFGDLFRSRLDIPSGNGQFLSPRERAEFYRLVNKSLAIALDPGLAKDLPGFVREYSRRDIEAKFDAWRLKQEERMERRSLRNEQLPNFPSIP